MPSNSLEHVPKIKKKYWYGHDLLEVISNRIKLRFNWIRTSNFDLKTFDTAVTLKYNHDHY